MNEFSTSRCRRITVGIDLGKRSSHVFAVSPQGEVLVDRKIPTSRKNLEAVFSDWKHVEVVIEVGPSSLWVNEFLKGLGHTVLVVNPREMPEIYKTKKKTDRVDARKLAAAAWRSRDDLPLVNLRSLSQHADLTVVRARMLLVKLRSQAVNFVRSGCSAFGISLSDCDTDYFHRKVKGRIPKLLEPALLAVVQQVESLSVQIKALDKKIDALCDRYPATRNLKTVHGVGPLTALTFVLTLHDHERFKHSRDVGSYVGLVPIVDQSSGRDPQLSISKCGDPYLRQLLVTAAHCVLRANAPDSDLRRHGLRICAEGSTNRGAKKRAVVAVARKLAVLLHHLWANDKTYKPFPNGGPPDEATVRVRQPKMLVTSLPQPGLS